MSDRPQKEFTTTGGYKVVMKEYITGAENREVRAIYMRASRLAEKEVDMADIESQADNKSFEIMVMSVDGPHLPDEGTIVDRILAMPIVDFREVAAAVSEAMDGKKKSATS